ncbi:MAG: Orotate phosphoribosyltransferase [Candidatus Woesebacteria bacterium GW2011_GWB1_45_5]|uniref:Orotate phosphoribosyltransferase n=1 Tax=Candidatus Woesebacteria bacterium GW2011_GWB1_45_5 TaxID=1618581 RepID=A0A0G1MR13_9BACT|nr:MAG: Orotate phosphoribosyltransferase [Candidatus Woesebacteria bacterium GW2011_GWB1_45_5]
MEREELGKLIYNLSLLKGEFLLKSGETSGFYFDKFKFLTDPILLKSIVEHMAQFLPLNTDLIAGPELGGAILATALSLKTDIKSLIVRKEIKEHGTAKIIEGQDVYGKTICIAEDVVTTGSTTIETTRKLRAAGAKVNTVICIINRNPEFTAKALQNERVKIHSLFVLNELGELQI